MTNSYAPKFLRAAILTAAAFTMTAAFAAAPQSRITQAISNQSHAELPGTLSPHARPANDAGRVPATTRLSAITLVFSRSPAQQAAIDALTSAQQNPASPLYHHFLTPEQFGAQFGVSASDIATTESWLQQQGFTIENVSRSRDRIQFSGTVAQAESAFNTQLHYYATSGGEKHFAPSTALSVPSALASSVLTITNLSNFHPHPHVKFHNASNIKPNFTSSQSGDVFLTPKDVATIYDINAAYSAGYNGAGQSIAVIGQSAVIPSDITNFQTALGIPTKAPTLVLVPGTGTSAINPQGVQNGDELESDLDLEYSSSIAPGATVYFVYTGSNANYGVFDSLAYAVDNNIAPIITFSYGDCEADFNGNDYTAENEILQQGVAQGETIVTSTGDSGSTDCWNDTDLSVATLESVSADFPASSQFVTAMGGTEIPTADINSTYFTASTGTDVISSAKSYVPEQVWNDDSALEGEENGASQALSSGGGGISTITPRPSWQTGVPGIPSGSFRLVPDISLLASPNNPGYLFCSSDISTNVTGSCSNGFRDATNTGLTVAGGTSFDAPIFAGLVAIINQARGYTTGQGLVTSELYTLASNPAIYATSFHDITAGGNNCTAGTNYCSTAGAAVYLATTGYDEASGLGSIDFYNLLTAWPTSTSAASSSFTVTAANATVTPGTNGTATITVTPANGFTGAVTFSVVAPSTLAYTCYTLPSTTVTGATAATSTLTIITNTGANTATSNCPSGAKPLRSATTASAFTSRLNHPATSHTISLAGIFAALLCFFGLGNKRSRRALRTLSQNPRALGLVIALSLATLTLFGCSNKSVSNTTTAINPIGPSTTTAAGTYTLTVIGTSTTNSAIVSRTTMTLTVN